MRFSTDRANSLNKRVCARLFFCFSLRRRVCFTRAGISAFGLPAAIMRAFLFALIVSWVAVVGGCDQVCFDQRISKMSGAADALPDLYFVLPRNVSLLYQAVKLSRHGHLIALVSSFTLAVDVGNDCTLPPLFASGNNDELTCRERPQAVCATDETDDILVTREHFVEHTVLGMFLSPWDHTLCDKCRKYTPSSWFSWLSSRQPESSVYTRHLREPPAAVSVPSRTTASVKALSLPQDYSSVRRLALLPLRVPFSYRARVRYTCGSTTRITDVDISNPREIHVHVQGVGFCC
jgi:hypothetical protein